MQVVSTREMMLVFFMKCKGTKIILNGRAHVYLLFIKDFGWLLVPIFLLIFARLNAIVLLDGYYYYS